MEQGEGGGGGGDLTSNVLTYCGSVYLAVHTYKAGGTSKQVFQVQKSLGAPAPVNTKYLQSNS